MANLSPMRIRNLNGNSKHLCACGSWLKHWENFSGQRMTYCPVAGCLNKDLVGAHVKKVGDIIDQIYVFPLCKTHHRDTAEFEVADAYLLVSANEIETCKKPKP